VSCSRLYRCLSVAFVKRSRTAPLHAAPLDHGPLRPCAIVKGLPQPSLARISDDLDRRRSERVALEIVDKRALSERDICTKFISPAIERAGWDMQTQLREEVYITNGRIIVRWKRSFRSAGLRSSGARAIVG
jgi:hypothetical protein